VSSDSDEDEKWAPHEPKKEYFMLHAGFRGDDIHYVRLRREKPEVSSWYYDFLEAKTMIITRTVGATYCEREIVRALTSDRDGRARAAFQQLTYG
jgi:hypothetical protein